MAHNKTVLLTAADKARASKARTVLDAADKNDRVLVHYERRDGEVRFYEGEILDRLGVDDKEAVVLDTINGPRTLNLWRAKNVSFL